MNKSSSLKALPVLFGFFIMGFCDVVGITSAHVKADFGLSDTLSNMIPVALFSMFLLFSVPTGILMNRIGRKRTVLLSNLITTVAMFLPLIGYTFTVSLVAFALLGIANTILQVSLNPLLTNVVKGDKLTSSLTAGQFVKAISSFCGPFIAIFAAERLGSWLMIFPIYALITVVSTVWLMALPIPKETVQERASSFGEVLSLLADTRILQLFLGILFVVGVDVGLNTVAPKILIERCGLSAASAGLGPSTYFAFRTVGTFLGAILLAKYSSERFFKINIIIAVVALSALIIVPVKIGIFALYAVIGFSIANVFPIIYSKAIQIRPDKANEISGLMITGVFGGAIIPFFMGLMSDWLNSQVGSVIVILISALYLLYCAFVVNTRKEEVKSHDRN
jgi:fucose permease